MKVLVTGGAGFIGTYLVKKLLVDRHIVTVVDIKDSKRLGIAVQVIADIRNKDQMINVINALKPDVVIHLAALMGSADPLEMVETNVSGTINVLNASIKAGVRRFINISSAAVYGDHSEPVDESSKCDPINIYGLTKLTAESLCSGICNANCQKSTEMITLRLFNVYGSLQKGEAIFPSLISAMKSDMVPMVFGGSQVRSFIHVTDVVDAIVIASTIESSKIGNLVGPINICNNNSITIKALACKILDRYRDTHGQCKDLEFLNSRKRDIYCSCGRNYLARHILGWSPEIDLDTGIRAVVDQTGGNL